MGVTTTCFIDVCIAIREWKHTVYIWLCLHHTLRYKPRQPGTQDKQVKRNSTPQMEANSAYGIAGKVCGHGAIDSQALQEPHSERVVLNVIYESSNHPDQYTKMHPAAVIHDPGPTGTGGGFNILPPEKNS